MNYKRKKSRQQIRCNMCTDGRQGNSLKELYGSGNYVKKLKINILKQKEQERML